MKKEKVDYYAYIEGGTRGIKNNIAPKELIAKHTTENISTIAFCDSFICKNCGIRLEDWIKVEVDYEYGYDDYTYPEYEFKFCPECGAKVKDGETE